LPSTWIALSRKNVAMVSIAESLLAASAVPVLMDRLDPSDRLPKCLLKVVALPRGPPGMVEVEAVEPNRFDSLLAFWCPLRRMRLGRATCCPHNAIIASVKFVDFRFEPPGIGFISFTRCSNQ